jgi:hypothetical protein
MSRPWLAGLVSSLIAVGARGAHAAPPPRLVATARAFSPCVPAVRTAHMAITGSAGHYRVEVLAVAVSPDRARIATIRADGVLQIDDVRSGCRSTARMRSPSPSKATALSASPSTERQALKRARSGRFSRC